MPVELQSYGLLADANLYFENRLHSTAWSDSTDDMKQQSLNQARELIDNLNFKSSKFVESQDYEWPRTGYELIPNDILIAERLIAIALLDGYDPEREIRQMIVTSRGYSSVKSTYDVTRIPDNAAVGIPSSQAWFHLKPYLKDAAGVHLNRVS